MKTLVGLVLCVALALPMMGQTYGEITGTVTDASGAAIPGAQVVVTNIATSVSRNVTTNAAGNYNVPFLIPGSYRIEASSEGFKQTVAPQRLLQIGDVARVDLQMEIGAVTESIEISAAAEMLQTASTATGTVIEQQRIVELPLNGRNYLQLVRLSPNVTAEMGAGGQANSRQGGERSNQALSISGQRQQYNRFTLDGVENTDVNFNTFVVRPSVDALQEFKVQSGVYSAEFGRASSQINVTTKAGTNDFHGVVFEFLRNNKIEARPWQQHGDKASFQRNQFGFTIDGPIVIPKLFNGKNRLFFMANYEGLRERRYGVARTNVADQAMRNGDFTGPAHLPIFDPDTIRTVNGKPTADPFQGQLIPSSRFKSQFTKMFEFYPLPNVPGAVLGVDAFNYSRRTPEPIDWDQFTTRVDFQESSNSQWFGRFSWGNELVTNGQTFEFQDSRIATKVYQMMLSNVRTLSPTVVNELRLGANIFDNDLLTRYNYERDVSGELGVEGLPSPIQAAWGTPGMGFDGNNDVSGWGENNEGPFVNRNRTYQLMDNVSIVKGNHSIRFGGELASRRFNQIGNQFSRGYFQFPSQYTADPSNLSRTGVSFATGLLGWTSESTRAQGIANLQFRQWSGSLYFEDSWKIRPTLTLTLGMRYENTPAWKDRYRGTFNVNIFCNGVDDTGIDESCPVPVLVRPGDGDFHEGFTVHIADIVPKATGDDVMPGGHATVVHDMNDFAPRIGVAWQPKQDWTIRAGYGVFYTQDTGNPVFDMGRNLGFRESARSLDLIPTANMEAPWSVKTSGGAVCSDWDGLCLSGLYTFANHADRRTPYVQQYLLNVQHQLTDTIMFEVGYSGNSGRKLQRMYGWNDPLQRNGPDDKSSTNQRRPWGGDIYGRIQTIGGGVNSSYNALSAKVQQRFSSGMTYLVGYTWARAIDSGSAIRTNDGDNLFPADNYIFTAERGLSQFHQKHRLTASILYEIPVGRGKRANLGGVGNTVLGDWALGSILTMSTGTPFNGGNCGDLNANTQGNRGDATGISPFLDNPTPQEYFARDASGRGAAAIACNVPNATGINELTYREGNIARNMYVGPGVFGWDFSAMKTFRFGERMNLEFRFESFNFPNHPNWNNPNTGTTSTNYGVITSARTMRTNQFGLKFAW